MTTTPSPPSPRRRLRRGEGALLRDEVLDAADRMLARTDEESVSMRAIAQEVGVSATAIYLHFPDKASLLFAVCQRHFASLDQALTSAEAGFDDPVEALRERGRAYVRFGLDNPEHYRILFMGRPGDDPPDWSAASLASSAAFGHQVEAVQRCIDAGAFPAGGDARLIAIGLWMTTHGITSLVLSKPGFPWPPIDQLLDHVLDTHGCGLVGGAGGVLA